MMSRWKYRWLVVSFAILFAACSSETGGEYEHENENQSVDNVDPNAGNAPEGEPKLEVRGEDELSWEMDPQEAQAVQFEVANVGDGPLEYTIDTGGNWLTFSPDRGQLDAGEEQTVDALATCAKAPILDTATVDVVSNGGDVSFEADMDCDAVYEGRLSVMVAGLPDGQQAAITVDGPADYSVDVTETTTLEEVPVGTHQITAEDVGEDAVYRPQPQETTVDVPANVLTTVNVEYAVVPGGVDVEVEGLPSGAEPDLFLVQGEDEWSIPADGLLEGMEPGQYTVIADSYQGAETVYEASDVAVTIVSGEITDVTVSYLIDPGYLDVEVNGLPEGSDHNIDVVADSDGEVTVLPESGSLTLEPGTYDVEPQEVEAGLATYEADGETVEISSGVTAYVEIDYSAIAGELPVVIGGELPDSASADVELVGPEQTTIEESETVELIPGEYTIEVNDVEDGGSIYEAASGVPTTVSVASGTNDELQIDYVEVLGELPVVIGGDLPTNVAADVDLAGPEQTTVEYSGTVELAPGEYTIDVNDVEDGGTVYEAASGVPAIVTVESGLNDELQIDYQFVTAMLTVEIVGELGGNQADVDITGPDGFGEHLIGTDSFNDLVPGEYTVEPHDVDDGTIYEASGTETVNLDSGDDKTVTVEYEQASGDIIVTIDEIGDVNYELTMVGPEGFSESLDGDVSFTGERPGEYEVVVDAEPIDKYGNPSYVDIEPGEFELESGETETVEITVRAAYVVITEADTGDGSLRYVMNNVVEHTVVEFYDDVFEIELVGDHIEVDKTLGIQGRAEPPVVVDGAESGRIFYVDSGGDLTVTDLVIRNGDADPGGAMRVVGDGRASVQRGVFENNESGGAAGVFSVEDNAEVKMQDSLFAGNYADGWGSVVDSDGGRVIFERSLFRDNVAGDNGAAVDTGGELEISHSTFINNESAGRVAAVMVHSGSAILEGLTVVQNSIGEPGPGPEGDDWAAGVYANWDTDTTLRASVVVDNDGGDVGGSLEHLTSTGFNVIGEVDDEFDDHETDQVGVEDAGLEGLDDNGGFTDTLALTDTSPARALIDGEECVHGAQLDWTRDQRLERRPSGGFCSAGAYELDATVETFDGADMSRVSYNDTIETFSGVDSIEWDYYYVKRQEEAEGDSDYIEGTSVVLEGDDGWIAAGDVSTGISSISMMLAQATDSTGPRQVEVFVDGDSVGVSPDVSDSGGGTQPYPWSLYSIDLSAEGADTAGDFDLEVRSVGGEPIVIDNLSWR